MTAPAPRDLDGGFGCQGASFWAGGGSGGVTGAAVPGGQLGVAGGQFGVAGGHLLHSDCEELAEFVFKVDLLTLDIDNLS